MIHFNPKIKPMTRRRRRAAFTLVEVLVVLVLLSILSGMVMTAVQGVTTSARMARTRSIIATVDSVIQEQYEAFKYRPFPVVIPDAGGIVGPTNTISHEIIPSEAARVRLIMTRDLQRMELPDKVSDVRQATNRRLATMPTVIRGMADRVLVNPTTGELTLARGAAGDLSQRSQFTVSWYAGSTATVNNDRGHWPARFSAYLRRTAALNAGTIRWTPQHQGAECLYLILATTFSSGVSAIEAIPASNIGDTDGDGVPEILDGWGRPLGFIRWPIGFADPAIEATVPDEFDPYRSDFGFSVSTVTMPYVVRPLVISAGADGEFGIAFTPRTTSLSQEESALTQAERNSQEENYSTRVWPVNATWMGSEAAGRSAQPYGYPDPFLRQYIVAAGGSYRLPGQALDGTAANSYRADNISNFQLEATE